MAKKPRSLNKSINLESLGLKRRIRLLHHVKRTKIPISKSLAENILSEDVRVAYADSENQSPEPFPEPTLRFESVYNVESDEDLEDIPKPLSSEDETTKSNTFQRGQSLFTIPSISSFEEAGLQQYYNSFLNTTRWQVSNLNVKPGDDHFLLSFFLSSYIPLICSCSGPMSNMLSLFAIICSWKINKADPRSEPDPFWCYLVNSISIFFALASNGFLLLNYRKTVRYTYCQVISIFGWFIASIVLTCLIIVYHWWFYHYHYDDDYVMGYGFYFAIFTVILHFLNFVLLSLNELGFLLKMYKPVFNINHVQSSLIVQTLCICVWLMIGASVFTRFLHISLGESLFYCTMSIVTIGSQSYVPNSAAAETLTSIWIIVGLVFFGLIISSIRQMIIEFSTSTIQWHRIEKMRRYVYENHKDDDKQDPPITPEESFNLVKYSIKWAFLFQEASELSVSIFIFMVILLCGAIGFSFLENWSYRASVYFSFYSLVTLGQGNTVPTNPGGMAFFSVWALAAIPGMTILVSTASDFVFSKLTSYKNSHLIDFLAEICMKHMILRPIGRTLHKNKVKPSLSVQKLMEMNREVRVSTKYGAEHDFIPLYSHPVDLLINVLMDYDRIEDLSFVNSYPYLESNKMSVHLANYNREGLEAEYDAEKINEIREHMFRQLSKLDTTLDMDELKANYGLELPESTASNDLSFDESAGVSVINKDNKIETGFRKKNDYVLSMLSKIQIVILELKRTSALMAIDPSYQHTFEEWDKFLKIVKNKHYKNDPLFWIGPDNPLAFPTHEPSFFTLHYLRLLNLLVLEFAAEYDQIDGTIPKSRNIYPASRGLDKLK